MSEPRRHFTPATFRFLKELAANNRREWFEANKDRYEAEVREPALQFIRDFAAPLHEISPFFRADPRKSGGSLFRIHRDMRFSRDQTPYKTYAGIQFRHVEARDSHAPGYYLHLEPRSIFAGLGIWHPDSDTLRSIRQALMERPDDWLAARDDPGFQEHFELAGDSLKRAPRGMDPDHPLIDDLKRKDFIGVTRLTQKAVTSPGFIDEFAALCRDGTPLVRFLCDVIGVRF